MALYVNARGLTTSAIPYDDGIFEVQFDFIAHELSIETSWGTSRKIALRAQSVAHFFAEFISGMKSLGIEVKIWSMPVEVPSRRARTLAVRWLVEFARNRREKQMSARLAGELLDAQSQQGGAYKRKDDIFRMAQANKAFAHYRW